MVNDYAAQKIICYVVVRLLSVRLLVRYGYLLVISGSRSVAHALTML